MPLLTTLKLALSNFIQQYHTSDNRLLRWSQLSLLFFLLTISLTSNSLQNYLKTNMQQLLGADIVLSSYHPLNHSQSAYINSHSQRVSITELINITLTNGQLWQAVQLKIVDDNYPLKGHLKLSQHLLEEPTEQSHSPAEGEIWVDSRLYQALKLSMGQTLKVGTEHYQLTHIIHHEPDRLLESHSVAMRAMIKRSEAYFSAKQDTEKNAKANSKIQTATTTNITQSQFRYLISTNNQQKSNLIQWHLKQPPGLKIFHSTSGHPLAVFWKRVENFLGLSSVLLFLMAAIAIDLASRRQLVNQKYFAAICLTMGMKRRHTIFMCFVQWFIGFFILLIPALGLSWLVQTIIIEQMQVQFPGLSSRWNFLVMLKTISILFLLLISFQAVNWYELSKVSVAQLIHKFNDKKTHLHRLVLALFSITGLTVIYSDNWLLTTLVLGSMLATLTLMMLLTWGILTTCEKASRNGTGLLPFSLFMMKQRLLSKSAQILGVGLCATLLLFTLLLMKDIGTTMQRYTRTHDGNLIISQAQHNHIDSIKDWASSNTSQIKRLSPYMPAQLIKVNNQLLEHHTDKPSDSMATVKKQIRIHWTQEIPTNNELVTGSWWDKEDNNWQQVSIEEEILTDLNLQLGDKLTFLINTQAHEFEIVASHQYKPGHGSITFWFQIPLKAVKHIEASHYYMGSMELPPQAWQNLPELWQKFPTLRMLSIKELTSRFDKTLSLITKLIVSYSVMIILLAIVVIIASVKGFEIEEKRKNGLLMSFGLSRKHCFRLNIYEWLITAVIASIGSISGTWLAGTLIYRSQFSMTYQPQISWLLITTLIILSLVCFIGLLSCRKSLNVTVSQLLTSY